MRIPMHVAPVGACGHVDDVGQVCADGDAAAHSPPRYSDLMMWAGQPHHDFERNEANEAWGTSGMVAIRLRTSVANELAETFHGGCSMWNASMAGTTQDPLTCVNNRSAVAAKSSLDSNDDQSADASRSGRMSVTLT